MISAVNEAINRKLASISFTTIINGIVESINPLRIRINSRIVIGSDFIEPKSLGINDYSPNQILPLIVGEKLQMVRYNNGQRFYILGKSASALNKKIILNTDNSLPLEINSNEIVDGTISLHKISKTGNYSDLNGIPNLDKEYVSLNKTQKIYGVKTFSILPSCTQIPKYSFDMVNKKYVDDNFLKGDSNIIKYEIIKIL